jgi:hypothetical protein
MDRRTLLKIMGGIAALPALGKAIKGTGIKAIKAAGKVLPKVSGMPEWFSPLVNKIMKEGKDVSPKVSRVEDMTTVKKLEIPSETGKSDIITLTQNKITGEISIESDVAGSVDNSPFELNYRPPKSDINLETGKEIKYPGDFSVIENRPRPTSEPGDYEFDYENLRVEDAYSDLERLEKIATGKIKDAKKIEERAAGRKMLEESPYEDIINRYPDPDIGDYDYANGGLASFANGGRAGYFLGGITKMIDSLGTQVAEKLPQEQQAIAQATANVGGGLGGLLGRIFSKVKDIVKPVATNIINSTQAIKPIEPIPPTTNPLTTPLKSAGFFNTEIVDILKRLGFSFADGGSVQTGLTKTTPPVSGPDPQGVESLFKRRYN